MQSMQGDGSLEQQAICPGCETSHRLFLVRDHAARVLQKHVIWTAEPWGTAPGSGVSSPTKLQNCNAVRGEESKEPQADPGFCRAIFRRAQRTSAARSHLGCITGGKTTPCRWRQPVPRQHAAAGKGAHVAHNLCSVLKYELGKETKRCGLRLKGTHLFLRSIYLFIN